MGLSLRDRQPAVASSWVKRTEGVVAYFGKPVNPILHHLKSYRNLRWLWNFENFQIAHPAHKCTRTLTRVLKYLDIIICWFLIFEKLFSGYFYFPYHCACGISILIYATVVLRFKRQAVASYSNSGYSLLESMSY